MDGALYVASGSRRGTDSFDLAKRSLSDSGVNLVEAKLQNTAQEMASAVERSPAELVIVGGGDGTLSFVAPIIAKQNKTLGVIPLGTGNSFARDLGIPTDIAEACSIVRAGKAVDVDTGLANGITFLNIATLGLTTLIAAKLDSGIKKYAAGAAYLLALIRAIPQVKPFEAVLTVNESEFRFRTMQIVIGNGRYHAGGLVITEDAALTSGKLHMYALQDTGKAAFLRLAMRMRFGKHTEMHEVRAFRFDAAYLETSPSRRVTLDGEIRTQAPVDLRSSAGALRVIVPIDWEARA